MAKDVEPACHEPLGITKYKSSVLQWKDCTSRPRRISTAHQSTELTVTSFSVSDWLQKMGHLGPLAPLTQSLSLLSYFCIIFFPFCFFCIILALTETLSISGDELNPIWLDVLHVDRWPASRCPRGRFEMKPCRIMYSVFPTGCNEHECILVLEIFKNT